MEFLRGAVDEKGGLRVRAHDVQRGQGGGKPKEEGREVSVCVQLANCMTANSLVRRVRRMGLHV